MYIIFLHPPFETAMYPISVYIGMLILLITTISLNCVFFFERISTEENPFLSRTSHEYNLCILAMLTMSCKDVKYVNWLNLGVINLRVLKSETRESAVKRRFPDDSVVKLATYLTI